MFPYEINNLDDATNAKLMSHFEGEKSGFCQVGPQKWLLPVAYKDHAEKYYEMPVKQDDIWIVTFPRSGTTWCQEFVWLINNKFDYKTAAEVPLETRFPFYEFSILHHVKFHEEIINLNNNDPKIVKQLAKWREHGYSFIPNIPSPRHIKTHLPMSLLPPNLLDTSKVFYVARNAKDVAVSYFHHNRLLKLHGYNGEFEQYWDYFKNDLLVYSPYWTHVKEGWERKNHPNLMFLFYEDLIKDLPGNIRKVANFLNKTVTDEEMKSLVNHLHIDNFRKVLKIHEEVPMKGAINEKGEGFFRRGKIGGNKEFTDELSKDADECIKENLKDTDLVFPVN